MTHPLALHLASVLRSGSSNAQRCHNPLCLRAGCQRTAPCQHEVYVSPPVQQGCICPPTSEQTCQNPLCPRQAVRATSAMRPRT